MPSKSPIIAKRIQTISKDWDMILFDHIRDFIFKGISKRRGKTRLTDVGPIIQQEKDTVEKMIRFYCNGNHSTLENELCSDCGSLLIYAHKRLDVCRYSEDKPTCRKCPTHCYNPEKRKTIRQVMRYSGPRLVIRAPITWIRHYFHERKKTS